MSIIGCSYCGDRFKKNDVIDMTLRIELDGSMQYLSIESIANMLLGKIKNRQMDPNMCKPLGLAHSKCIRNAQRLIDDEMAVLKEEANKLRRNIESRGYY